MSIHEIYNEFSRKILKKCSFEINNISYASRKCNFFLPLKFFNTYEKNFNYFFIFLLINNTK